MYLQLFLKTLARVIANSILTISHIRVERKCSRSRLAPMFLKTTVPPVSIYGDLQYTGKRNARESDLF